MTRPFSTMSAMTAHWDAEDRIPVVREDYAEALDALNNRRSDGAATRADYDRIAELTGELARLHADEVDYYTRLTASYAEWAADATGDKQ